MGMPLGGTPFDPKTLQVRPPASDASDAWLNTVHDGIIDLIGDGDTTAALDDDDDPIHEREPAPGMMPNYDATRIVEDFSLEGVGFETRVFSTAELADAEELGIPSYDAATAEARSPIIETTVLSPLMESRAQPLLSELLGLADVVFVKLVTAEGVAIMSAGNASADFRLDRSIAAVAAAAEAEVLSQGFGEVGAVALESEKAALLVSSLHAGTVLAISVSNPTRLGLLRRQVRKPIAGLRSLLMESSVS
jgi:predicted regulator of Ras-like GTPase activity (Roadblock/LC7/MglB family)